MYVLRREHIFFCGHHLPMKRVIFQLGALFYLQEKRFEKCHQYECVLSHCPPHPLTRESNTQMNLKSVQNIEWSNLCSPPHLTKGLVLGEDYRLVNYNVWKYWSLIYGGGPSIGRASKDIYGLSAIGIIARGLEPTPLCYDKVAISTKVRSGGGVYACPR